ncbi:MAG: carboxypeptidase regulatory-like domain-containing protein [Sandaracinaceae bacterium]
MRAWILGVVAALALGLLLVFLFTRRPDGTFSLDFGGSTAALDDGGVLGGASGSDDGVAGGPGLAAGADAGVAVALGEWAPFATVTRDPSSPNGSLTGRVVSSADDHPIAHAELLFVSEETSISATSREDGSFAIAVSQPGRYALSIANADGFLPYAPELGHSGIAFEARPELRVDGVVVRLDPERRIEVLVTDEADRPIEGATVRLLGAGNGDRRMMPVDDTFTTDADGIATVGAWRGALIEARHDPEGVGRERVPFRRGDASRVKITLSTLRDDETGSERIAGTVLDEAGAPLSGVMVSAHRQMHGTHPWMQAISEDDGRFEITGLDRGAHAVIASHPDRPRAEVGPIASGTTDVVIRMQAGLAIHGRVVDGHGAPVPAFQVMARAADRRGWGSMRSAASYDGEGRFTITGLEAGTYTLSATARGFPHSASVEAEARPGGGPEVTLTITEGGRLVGVVRDATDSHPIGGARIALETFMRGRGTPASTLPSSVSGPDGAFVLEGLGELRASVRVTAEGYHTRLVSGFSMQAGERRELDIELTPVEEGEEARTELVGIGVNIFPRGEYLGVGFVMPGGGAEAAGLTRGDQILAIDGVPVEGLGYSQALERIRGDEGTTVVLRVRRGDEEPTDVPIVRRRIRT